MRDRIARGCRGHGDQVTFEASATPATFVLRVRQKPSVASVSADGETIARVDAVSLGRSDTEWTVDNTVAIVKARARRIEIR